MGIQDLKRRRIFRFQDDATANGIEFNSKILGAMGQCIQENAVGFYFADDHGNKVQIAPVFPPGALIPRVVIDENPHSMLMQFT
jgi:hypothetical protein